MRVLARREGGEQVLYKGDIGAKCAGVKRGGQNAVLC